MIRKLAEVSVEVNVRRQFRASHPVIFNGSYKTCNEPAAGWWPCAWREQGKEQENGSGAALRAARAVLAPHRSGSVMVWCRHADPLGAQSLGREVPHVIIVMARPTGARR